MTSPRYLAWMIALLALVLLASACGDDGDASSDPTPTPTEDAGDDSDDSAEPTPTPEPTAAPTPTPVEDVDLTDLSVRPVIEVPTDDPSAELVVEDIVEGTGDRAALGDVLFVHYVGAAHSTRAEFDASWDRGEVFRLTLGQGSVIAGWDQGLEDMAVGGRRLLEIPPDLAYGEEGRSPIAPDETIYFIVDLVGRVPADAEKPDVPIPDAPAEELTYEDLRVGEGLTPNPADRVYFHFVGVAQSTGEQFDASWDRGIEYYEYRRLGVGQLIQGLENAFYGMSPGGRRLVVVPPDLAYGDAGAGGGAIAPGETLVFVVDLLWIDEFTGG